MTRRERLARVLAFAQRRWSRACGQGCHNVCEYRHRRNDDAVDCDACRRARQWRDVVHRLEAAGFADPVERRSMCLVLAWGNDPDADYEKPAAPTSPNFERVDFALARGGKLHRLQRQADTGRAPEDVFQFQRKAA